VASRGTLTARRSTPQIYKQTQNRPIDIHTAALMGDSKAIHQHIMAGSTLNEKDEYGSTALESVTAHLRFLANIFIYVILLSPVFFYIRRNENGKISKWLKKRSLYVKVP